MSTATVTTPTITTSAPSVSSSLSLPKPSSKLEDSKKKEPEETVNSTSNSNSNSRNDTKQNSRGKTLRITKPSFRNHDAKVSSVSTQTAGTSTKMLTPKSPYFVYSYLDPSAGSHLDELEVQTDTDPQTTNYSKLAETAVGVREISKKLARARIRTVMKTVMLVTKPSDVRLVKLTRELAMHLITTPRYGKDYGVVVYVDENLKNEKRFKYEELLKLSPLVKDHLKFWTKELCAEKSEVFNFVLTLGGDGTVLYTSWLFQKVVPPVMSFHLGSLGFLTNFDFQTHPEHLADAMEKGIRVNLRMRFTCTVYRRVVASGNQMVAKRCGETGEIMMENLIKGNGSWDAVESKTPIGSTVEHHCALDKNLPCFITQPAETFEVLNDLVVDRGAGPYMSLLELFADDEHMTTVQADGLVVATPTGSTAYSVSAGGSLVHPEISALLITPICPHTLSFRPMLLPDSMELRICVPFNSRSTAWASFDGRGRLELKRGDHIKITPSKFPFPSVCLDNQSRDWFNSLTRCLKWNERERQRGFVVVEDNVTDNETDIDDKGNHDIEPYNHHNSPSDDDTSTKVDDENEQGERNENSGDFGVTNTRKQTPPPHSSHKPNNFHHHHHEHYTFACIGRDCSSEETGSGSSEHEEDSDTEKWRVVTRGRNGKK
ncbi:5842_t:CDS:2 [Ambispora gerdemannii]|uniref:5842_t:CDS:1 n=1 Tax=Ambispora gerdemannii TaxID=144530 RepID=A0A9N9AIZ8_9GLOM|nr:5842_t:CDS:2 [Ambispora gerdemannii]